MAYTEIVITRFGDHLVSMLLKDGHPVEFQCVSEKNKVDIGNIYIGVVKNVVKNINGAFVEFDCIHLKAIFWVLRQGMT